jgi:predicted transcriptional regulator
MAHENSAVKPTEAELTLLNVLWNMGPATVRQIHDVVSQTQKNGLYYRTKNTANYA